MKRRGWIEKIFWWYGWQNLGSALLLSESSGFQADLFPTRFGSSTGCQVNPMSTNNACLAEEETEVQRG